jgi:hypothetical protein
MVTQKEKRKEKGKMNNAIGLKELPLPSSVVPPPSAVTIPTLEPKIACCRR